MSVPSRLCAALGLAAVLLVLPGFQLLTDPAPAARRWVDDTLARLTLEQKVAQLFSAWTQAYYASADDPSYQATVDLVERFGIGGVIFSNSTPAAQAALANDLQLRADVPLLISQDTEWGIGMRVERSTILPRTMAIGATRDPRYAYAAGFVTAREARAVGTHQLYAPVADVNNNPRNPVINVRSYGEDPALVAEMVAAYIRGARAGGALSTVKHFPGHGDTGTDSHYDLPVLPFTRARLDTLELVPFRAALAADVPAVMTGHLALPQLEPEPNVPGTLSPAITTALLRDDLGFEGLIVTDALDMQGVAKHFGVGEAAVRALEAGADVLLMSGDPYAARAAVLRAVEAGRLSEERIEASVRRVLEAKTAVDLHQNRLVNLADVRNHVATQRHAVVAESIARDGMTLLRNEGALLPLPVDSLRLLSVALSDRDDPDVGTYFAGRLRAFSEGVAVNAALLTPEADDDDYERVLRQAREADVIVVPAFQYVRAWSGTISLQPDQQAFVDRLIATGKPVVLVAFGNPYVAVGLEAMPDAFIAAYGGDEASQTAVAQGLFGRAGFGGRLPVRIPELYPYGAGLDLAQTRLRRGAPEEAGLAGDVSARIDSLIRAAIDQRVFPGAAVAVGRGDVLAHLDGYGYYTYDSEQRVTPTSVFDLASLTKVIATTTAAMQLYEQGRLELDAPVARYLPAFGNHGKEAVTIRQLLTHSAGLIPFRPFHTLGVRTREEVVQTIMNESLQYEPGTKSQYSDLGMITMALVVEAVTGRDFAAYAREEIFEPLGMTRTGFRAVGTPDTTVVPTEIDQTFRQRLVQGEVHDETAWLLGGTAGHAGLFSTAADLARFATMLVDEGCVDGEAFLEPETIRLFTRRVGLPESTRALGWDTRSETGYSSAGRLFGPASFGHTGFTGTSLWIDPDVDLYVILLTNRVYPTRENSRIAPVRAQLADLVFQALRGPAAPLLPRP